MIPPCTFPVGVERARCGVPALYGFRLDGWPDRQRAAVCPAHAIATRTLHPVAVMWSIRPWRAPVRERRRGRVRPLR